MKFKFIKSTDKEEVIVYAKERNDLVDALESLCVIDNNLVGYYKDSIYELNINLIECFITENDKVYALIGKNKYLIKRRLYELHELYKEMFIYINQGCLANISKISHFDASIGGSLLVVFKSNYKDYVSRRRLKEIKERMGLK